MFGKELTAEGKKNSENKTVESAKNPQKFLCLKCSLT